MTQTTAQLRASAREAERLLLWGSAAALYEMAADAYPPASKKPGTLAYLDIQRLRERAASCWAMVSSEKWTPETARRRIGGTIGT